MHIPAWVSPAIDGIKKHWKGLLVTGGLFVLGVIAQGWLDAFVVQPFLGWIRVLADAKVGYVGIAFFGLLFWSVIERHPRFVAWRSRRASNAKNRAVGIVEVSLSTDEKDAVARIRSLWNIKEGASAAQGLLTLLEYVKGSVEHRYYVEVHRLTIARLESASTELTKALDVERAVPLADVVAAFNSMFKAYLRAAEVLYESHQHKDVDLFADEPLFNYWAFRKLHKVFADDLLLATEYPGIHKQLYVFSNRLFAAMTGGPPPSRRFLGEHDWAGQQPPSLAARNFTPSASDTAALPHPESAQ